MQALNTITVRIDMTRFRLYLLHDKSRLIAADRYDILPCGVIVFLSDLGDTTGDRIVFSAKEWVYVEREN